MKKTYLLFFICFVFSCKKKEIVPVVENNQIEITNFSIDNDLKLIISNMDISSLIIEEKIDEFILGEKYELENPTSSLEIGKKYFLEKNNITYQFYFSELPILEINANEEIVDEPKVTAKANLITINSRDPESFDLGIEIRGGFSQTFEKKSYGFEIWEDATGSTSKDLSLLGMREDDDWILDAMYNDPLRMRNLISHRLWNDIHVPHYIQSEPEAKATIRSEYVEIFINGKYNGIYALSERPDRKLLKLKKYDSEIRGEMYKGIAWINALFTGIVDYDNTSRTWGGFEMEYPTDSEITDWSKVYDFVDFVINSSDDDFKNSIYQKIYTENFIDYFIFLNLIRALDNTGKNVYLAKYDKDEPYFYMPWDMDGSWGNQYDGMRDDATDGILTNGLYNRLNDLNPNSYLNVVKNRWSELRNNELSQNNILNQFNSAKELLENNGVYTRESLKWNYEYQEDDYIYMSIWLNERWDFLNNHFQ